MQTAVFRLTLCPVVAPGADDPYGLRGISSVWMLIESLGPEEANIGLADDTVHTDVELRLRSAGLRVISLRKRRKSPSKTTPSSTSMSRWRAVEWLRRF